MKKTAGFTLVELIVVIAILAILAGIAIPVYSGYIDKAQQAADMQTLDSIKTAAVFAAMSKNPEAEVTQIDITGGNTVSVTWKVGETAQTALANADLEEYTGTIALKYVASATWTPADGWKDIVKQS